jgi:hypothetical protein
MDSSMTAGTGLLRCLDEVGQRLCQLEAENMQLRRQVAEQATVIAALTASGADASASQPVGDDDT